MEILNSNLRLQKIFHIFPLNIFMLIFLFLRLVFFFYLRDEKFNLVVIYLFFLSIILEVAHFVISVRSFQIEDLTGNILGVLIVYIIVLIYKF